MHATTCCKKLSAGGGRDFLLVLFCSGTVYLVVFGGINHRNGKRGQDLLPHREFWAGLAALVRDGVQYSRGRLQGHSAGSLRDNPGNPHLVLTYI